VVHKNLKAQLVSQLLQVDSRFGFDLCFHRRLTRADEKNLLPRIAEYYKSVITQQSEDATFHPGADREFPLDELDDDLGRLTISRLENNIPCSLYFGVGDLYNIYLGNEDGKIRDDLFDGDRCKYKQLPAGDSGIIVVKVDSDSHEADDVVVALASAQQLQAYPNLSAVVLLSKWRKLNGGTSSAVILNTHAQCPLSDQGLKILQAAFLSDEAR
jgi:hypothetical protein